MNGKPGLEVSWELPVFANWVPFASSDRFDFLNEGKVIAECQAKFAGTGNG
ncbi:MAG: hypothetical protein IT569_00740 [Leptospiraceae bacterium]|nr:hypothetical protein [Leptospiraceae bacterium]